MYFALPNFVGAALLKVVPNYHTCLTACHVVKFRKVTPTNPKLQVLTCWILSQNLALVYNATASYLSCYTWFKLQINIS